MSAPFDNPSARLRMTGRMSGPERPDFDAIRRTIVGEDQHCECAEQYMTPLITYALHVEAQRDAAREALAQYGQHEAMCDTIVWMAVEDDSPEYPCSCGLAVALGDRA